MFACFLDWVAVWLTLLLLPFSLPIPSREDIHKTGDQNSNMADNGMLTDAQIMEDPSGKFEHEKEVKRIEEARAVDGLFSMNVSDSLFEHLFPYNRGSRAWTTRKVVVGGESEHHLLEFPFVSDFLPFLLRLLNILPPETAFEIVLILPASHNCTSLVLFAFLLQLESIPLLAVWYPQARTPPDWLSQKASLLL